MFDVHDISRDAFMLDGSFAKEGYDWWWHSFTAIDKKTKEEKPFFIEFFTINPALGGKEPVFGQLPYNKERHIHPSYLMVKAGWWGKDHKQLHRFFGWDDVKIDTGVPFSIQAGDCYLDENHIRGSVSVLESENKNHPEWMSDAGSISFNLDVFKIHAFNVGYGASKPLRDAKGFEMYWHAEGMKSAFKGTITADGREYEVIPEKSYGYSDKNWGKDFTSPWVWLSSNDIVSNITGKRFEDDVFDIGGGRPKAFGIAMDRKLLGGFLHDGVEYDYNFSKIWEEPHIQFECHETDKDVVWHIDLSNHDSRMITDALCHKEDMLFVNYEAPDGEKRYHHLWNGGNGTARIQLFDKHTGTLIDDLKAGHIGCEYGEYDQ